MNPTLAQTVQPTAPPTDVWVTTRQIRDGYGYRVQAGELVRWTPGSKVEGLLSKHQYTYSPITDTTFFRPPTPAELDQLTNIPLRYEMTIRGGGEHIGSDPEVFVTNGEGRIIPAWKFLPPKESPVKVGHQTAGWNDTKDCHIYWDGFQAEFTTPPSHCLAYFADAIQHMLTEVQTRARAFDPSARLTGECVLPIPASTLSRGSRAHVELGCMPSLNAYQDVGVQAGNGRNLPIRFAGCHIHVAKPKYEKWTAEKAVKIVKTCDAVAGVLSVAILEGLEHPDRRRYYGLAGEYRLPEHGLEYRVLSSAILWHPGLFHMHCNFVRFARELVEKGLEGRWVASESEVRHVINTLDVDGARAILARNRAVVEEMLWGLYHDLSQPLGAGQEPKNVPSPSRIFSEFLLVGVRKYIELDMEKNWHLSDGLWAPHSEGPASNGWRSITAWLGAEKKKASHGV